MIRAIVTDIEGTTSSLSFVKDVLFPYSRERMAEFVRARAQDPTVRKHLDDVKRTPGLPAGQASGDLTNDQAVEQLIRWIDEDRKVTPLKALQGMIWEEGFKQGRFKGHVYEDAVRILRIWKERGIRLYVFSSGSIQAQRLLFAHTEHGDLTPLFSDYFDTTVGAKNDPAAYRKIVGTIGLTPGEILFLSDVKEELDAARQAGMKTAWLVRDGAIDSMAAHRQVKDFNAIAL